MVAVAHGKEKEGIVKRICTTGLLLGRTILLFPSCFSDAPCGKGKGLFDHLMSGPIMLCMDGGNKFKDNIQILRIENRVEAIKGLSASLHAIIVFYY